jgi:hypothetical protein
MGERLRMYLEAEEPDSGRLSRAVSPGMTFIERGRTRWRFRR